MLTIMSKIHPRAPYRYCLLWDADHQGHGDFASASAVAYIAKIGSVETRVLVIFESCSIDDISASGLDVPTA
jgi:hypothetical protein